MSIENIIDQEMDNDPLYADPTHGFKGSKDEWALSWVEKFMIPSEFELQNVENECALRRLLAMARKFNEINKQR